MLAPPEEIALINSRFGILDHIPIGILILKKDFTVLFWNKYIEDWTGIPRNSIIGTDINTHFPHFKMPKYSSRLYSIFEGGPPTIFSSQLHANIIPSTLGDGRQCVQHTIVTPVWAAENNGFYALFSIQDVTDLTHRIQDYRTMRDRALGEVTIRQRAEQELLKTQEELELRVKERTAELVTINQQLQAEIIERKQIEEELKKLLTTLHTLVDHIPEGVLLLAPDYRVVLSNSIGETYLKTLSAASVGEMVTEISGHSLKDLFEQSQNRICQEIVISGPPGYIFELAGSTIEQGSIAKGMVLVLKDVTEERSLQERIYAQERLAAVGQLAAGIAHDFNNILTGIIGFADVLLTESTFPYEDRQMIEGIFESGMRAAHLIRQILDFSRKSYSAMKPLGLSVFLAELTQFIRRTIPENIKISLRCDPNEHVVVADTTKIQQIITNLALNARDAMPEGGVLSFSLSRLNVAHSQIPPVPDMPDGEWVVLTVTDTGTGITSETIPHIFEPFFTTKEPGKGTGLGLSQVYGIVKQHNGFIDVHTEMGVGTSFIIYLPAGRNEEAVSDKVSDLEMPEGKCETILVVEDNAAIRNLIHRKLTKLNYQVLTANNGREALLLFEEKQHKIKLIITDLVMPDMGGVELSKTIRSKNSLVKIIAISGYPLCFEEKDILDTNFFECITKPFHIITLVQAVSDALGSEVS